MAAALVAIGEMTRAELATGLATELTGPFDDSEYGHIESPFRPPSSPSEYRLPQAPAGVPWSIELERGIRDVAHAGQLDQGFVETLVSRGYAAAIAPPKSPAQREMQARLNRAELARVWGTDFEKNMSLAQEFVSGIIAKRPGFRTALDMHGLGDDPAIIRLFHSRAMARKEGQTWA